ncbi:LAMI_0D02982g1_1 [Lachancea mirantina]|uniref:LAMI_0D02982g1_1 n=1 Tax=Lachancea mirantina TaxID=1230905 RepID=A0A1G4J9H6_9SACH|nr:LAMI_0D02982g1_1 [Lachancea mirantina]
MSGKIEHLVKRYCTREELSNRGVWRGELYKASEWPFFERGWCWKTLLLGEEDGLLTRLEPVALVESEISGWNATESSGLRRLTPVVADNHPLELCNPTQANDSREEDDRFKEKLSMMETLEIIELDVRRLLLDKIFAHEQVKSHMVQILYNYVVENNTSYKQGYHELCGAVYLQMLSDEPEMRVVNTFNIFNKLMVRIRPVFYEEKALIAWSKDVFDTILKLTIPRLHTLLTDHHKVDSTLWLIRWTRLLFLRELDLSYALRIWDHILTFTYPVPDLIACVIVVMLIAISQELHSCEDQGDIISLLLHYPSDRQINCVDLMKHSANLYELYSTHQFQEMPGFGEIICRTYNREWYDKSAQIKDPNRLRLEERLKRRVEWRLQQDK